MCNRFEDGESDGVRIPDNSVRKTLRQRGPQKTASPAAANNTAITTATSSLTTGINGDPHRRKSRRHSTGNSPLQLPPPIPPHPKGYAPSANLLLIQQTVDEDSSSSGSVSMGDPQSPMADGNCNNGVGVTNGNGAVLGSALLAKTTTTTTTLGAGAGVTPGLRRRRERAERQKLFIREQQDASARAADVSTREDTNNHGMFLCVHLVCY